MARPACDLRAGVRLAVAWSISSAWAATGCPCEAQLSRAKNKRQRGGGVCDIFVVDLWLLIASAQSTPESSSLTTHVMLDEVFLGDKLGG